MSKDRKYTESEVRAAYAAAAVKMFDLEVGTLSVYDEYGRLDVAATDAARAKEIAEIELGNKILESTYIVYSNTFHLGDSVPDPEADSDLAIIGFGFIGTEQIFRKVGLKRILWRNADKPLCHICRKETMYRVRIGELLVCEECTDRAWEVLAEINRNKESQIK